jgi:aerobic carbon-monoxide dehydrogenase medium subunit
MLPPFELVRPHTVSEVVAAIDEDALPYCGGTELFLAMKMGLLRPQTLVDLKGVPELAGVGVVDDVMIIGATTSHADVAGDPRVRALFPVLADMEHRVGNARIRSQGTIGGNLVFAEPRSDVTTVLAALDAQVVLASADGERRLPMADFLLGAYWVDREPGELLRSVEIPVPAGPRAAVYLKMQVTERPTVGVAAVDLGDRVRVVVGAVGDVPLIREVDTSADDPIGTVLADLEPIEDLAGSARYKRHVAGVWVRRALDRVKEKAA